MSRFATYGGPRWSDTGTHLVAWRFDSNIKIKEGVTQNVYRAAADGSNVVDLTSDVDAFAFPVAWR